MSAIEHKKSAFHTMEIVPNKLTGKLIGTSKKFTKGSREGEVHNYMFIKLGALKITNGGVRATGNRGKAMYYMLWDYGRDADTFLDVLDVLFEDKDVVGDADINSPSTWDTILGKQKEDGSYYNEMLNIQLLGSFYVLPLHHYDDDGVERRNVQVFIPDHSNQDGAAQAAWVYERDRLRDAGKLIEAEDDFEPAASTPPPAKEEEPKAVPIVGAKRRGKK